jgi:twitching motility protein PilI
MANREALRELQARLAGRLQAARTEGVQASWLAVESGGAKFLFPLSQSGEIFPYANTLPVPYTQPWFLGVANLRGGLYGVVDLASFVSGKAPVQRSDATRAESRLVALNSALEINCALLIDRLAGLRNMDAFSSSSPPPDGAPEYFGTGYTDAGGAHWQEINLQALSQQPTFLSIGALAPQAAI